VIQRAADEHGATLALPVEQLATVLLDLSSGFAIARGIDPGAVPDDLFERLLALIAAAGPPESGPAR
jgi:hypothetical protein